MFYCMKVYTEGSEYYDKVSDYYDFKTAGLIPRGDDLAGVGPIWVNTQ